MSDLDDELRVLRRRVDAWAWKHHNALAMASLLLGLGLAVAGVETGHRYLALFGVVGGAIYGTLADD